MKTVVRYIKLFVIPRREMLFANAHRNSPILTIAPRVKLPGRWLRRITLLSQAHQPLGREKTEGLCCQLGRKSEAALLPSSLLVPVIC